MNGRGRASPTSARKNAASGDRAPGSEEGGRTSRTGPRQPDAKSKAERWTRARRAAPSAREDEARVSEKTKRSFSARIDERTRGVVRLRLERRGRGRGARGARRRRRGGRAQTVTDPRRRSPLTPFDAVRERHGELEGKQLAEDVGALLLALENGVPIGRRGVRAGRAGDDRARTAAFEAWNARPRRSPPASRRPRGWTRWTPNREGRRASRHSSTRNSGRRF